MYYCYSVRDKIFSGYRFNNIVQVGYKLMIEWVQKCSKNKVVEIINIKE